MDTKKDLYSIVTSAKTRVPEEEPGSDLEGRLALCKHEGHVTVTRLLVLN